MDYLMLWFAIPEPNLKVTLETCAKPTELHCCLLMPEHRGKTAKPNVQVAPGSTFSKFANENVSLWTRPNTRLLGSYAVRQAIDTLTDLATPPINEFLATTTGCRTVCFQMTLLTPPSST